MEDGAAYREDQGKESSGDHFLSSPADHHPGEAETKGESPRGADPDPDVFLLPVSPCGEEALESDVAMDPWWWTVTLFLCFFCWSFLWVLVPLLPSHNGLSVSQIPFLLHFAATSLSVSLILFPFLLLLTGVAARAVRRDDVISGMVLPAAAYTLWCLPAVVIVLSLGKWERPVITVTIVAVVSGYAYVAVPVALAMVVRAVRRHGTPIVTRVFVKAGMMSMLTALEFFFSAFIFMTLFYAARRSIPLQLVALLVYALLAHVVMKKVLVPKALGGLSKASAASGSVAMMFFFECIAELFLAFSFPSSSSPFVLCFAVLLEALLFLASVRKLIRKAKTSASSASPTSSPSDRAEDVVRATAFGILFVAELLSAVTFALVFAAACFGPNASSFGFGSLADGSCTPSEYLRPVAVAESTAVIHCIIFLLCRRPILSILKLDPLQLALHWLRRHSLFLATVLPVTYAQIFALTMSQYDISGLTRSLVA